MAFLKKPLKWTALGQEPSELKKTEGFKMDESPAPGHFDFMFRSTYEAIEELQQKAGEVKTVNNVQPDSNGNVLIPLPDTSKVYQKPTSGIPKADLDTTVQASLKKADDAAPLTELAKTNQALTTHQADNTHIFNIDVTYATNVYTVANAPAFTDYLTVRFKAPNAIVDTATFKIGTDVYAMVNAYFELNEIVIVTFDKAQKKVFFRRGSDLEPLLPSQVSTLTANPTGLSGQLKVDWSISDTTNLNDLMFVYKTGGYPTNSKDGTQIIVSKTSRTTTLSGLTNGTTYYIRAYPRNAKKQVQSSYKVANGVPIIADDTKLSPGPIILAKGTMQEGYFGLVTSAEMITGDALTTLVGITQGTSQNSTTNWLKFAYKGKVLFVAQKPIRYSLSWDSINAVGAVTGTKQVAIKSLNYKVRLLQGALTNPSENNAADLGAKGSEWNRLMLAVHEQVKNKNWDYPAYVEADIQDFGTYFTDAELYTKNNVGNGTYSWCQETTKSDSSSRVIRGLTGVSYSNWNTSSHTTSHLGWRPVLELI